MPAGRARPVVFRRVKRFTQVCLGAFGEPTARRTCLSQVGIRLISEELMMRV